jgi:uncharacterized protein HemX
MPESKIVDTKIPLTWVVRSAISVILAIGIAIWMVATQYTNLINKQDQMLTRQAESERRAEIRSDQQQLVISSHDARISATERELDKHDVRIENLERARQGRGNSEK